MTRLRAGASWLLRGALVAVTRGAAASRSRPTTERAADAELYACSSPVESSSPAIVWGLATWRSCATEPSRRSDEPGCRRGGRARTRRRGRPGPAPPQTHGHNRLEIVWTAIPLVTVLVLFAADLRDAAAVERPVAAARRARPRRRRSAGDGGSSTGRGRDDRRPDRRQPELVVPVGEPVHVTLTATTSSTPSTCRSSCSSRRDPGPRRNRSTSRSTSRARTAATAPSSAACTTTGCSFSDPGRARPDFDAWLASARSQPQPILATAPP